MLLGVKSVGICGSDVHFWTDGRIGDYILQAPMVMGHEASATVIAVGDGVTHLQKGSLITIVVSTLNGLYSYPLPFLLIYVHV